ncbi:MAG: kynureninase [Blastocatellia bacterium]|nr:kynureninase [Blastocatellia bacterium]
MDFHSSLAEHGSSQTFASEADAPDPLAHFRSKFHLPKSPDGHDLIYFAGNSLGLQPVTVRTYIEQELDDWARLGVEGHVHARKPWLPYHEFVADPLARLVGAKPVEVVAMNSLTVNLHLLMVSFYRPTPERYKIVIEKGAFPSDQYAVESQLQFHGYDRSGIVELTPRDGETILHTDDILTTIDREGDAVALIMLGGVNYYTGQAFDMSAITAAGHAKGCIVGFDLAHAAGNLKLDLHDWNVDFAAWCSYKYLNAGPGGIAGIFVHERHAFSFDLPRFAGWWGHDKESRFKMGPDFKPLAGAEGWQLSNPPIFQLAALRASLELFDQATIAELRKKSEKLTGYLEFLLNNIETERISIITPSDPAARGCQLSIRVHHADRSLFEKLTAQGVIADWREPDVIRVAPVPLYNSFTDVYRFSKILEELV